MNNYVWCVHGAEHAALAMKSAELVRIHDPMAWTVVYTDEPRDMGPAVEHVIPVPAYHDKPFMLMNVLCQLHFLCEKPDSPDGFTVFLDADAFMARPLPDLDDFDVAVTWRDNMGELSKTQPYNYGVVMARPNVHSISAWAWMADRISRMAQKQQAWYGNQIALRELCGPVPYGADVSTQHHDWFDVNVKYLPCAQWNWTPPDDNPKQELTDQVFVHAKGSRKDLLDYYYPRCLKGGK